MKKARLAKLRQLLEDAVQRKDFAKAAEMQRQLVQRMAEIDADGSIVSRKTTFT